MLYYQALLHISVADFGGRDYLAEAVLPQHIFIATSNSPTRSPSNLA